MIRALIVETDHDVFSERGYELINLAPVPTTDVKAEEKSVTFLHSTY